MNSQNIGPFTKFVFWDFGAPRRLSKRRRAQTITSFSPQPEMSSMWIVKTPAAPPCEQKKEKTRGSEVEA